MNVTNRSKTPIGLPGNTILEPGETRFILNWAECAGNAVVKAWLHRGVLVVDTSAPSAPSALSESTEKDALIARLKERGITRNRRASVETLRALLDEAGG
jgi:hypothetical protein